MISTIMISIKRKNKLFWVVNLEIKEFVFISLK